MPNTREKLIELPIDDAIRIFREEFKHRSEAYTTHLSYGGKGDPAEEVYIEALGMATSALEQTKWISVKDRLPKMRNDGFADAFLVTDGTLAHIAYCVDGDWIFTDNGQMKEPMFYDVTHWQYLPQPPKGE